MTFESWCGHQEAEIRETTLSGRAEATAKALTFQLFCRQYPVTAIISNINNVFILDLLFLFLLLPAQGTATTTAKRGTALVCSQLFPPTVPWSLEAPSYHLSPILDWLLSS